MTTKFPFRIDSNFSLAYLELQKDMIKFKKCESKKEKKKKSLMTKMKTIPRLW